jgi:hypothetical protein
LEHRLGGDWDDLAMRGRLQERSAEWAPLLQDAEELLRGKIGTAAMFGLKDPRLAILLPFWQRVFEAMGLDVRYVIAHRHPKSVANSLARRNAMPPEKAYMLWLAHQTAAIRETRGKCRVVVNYDLMMEQPCEQLSRMARKLALPQPDERALQEYAGDFLDESLRHFRFSTDDLACDPAAPVDAVQLHETLDRLAVDASDCSDAELAAMLDRLDERQSAFAPAMRLLSSLDVDLARTSAHAADQARQLAEQQSIIDSDRRRIADYQQWHVEQQQNIAAQQEQIAMQQEQLAAQQEQLAAQREQLSSVQR